MRNHKVRWLKTLPAVAVVLLISWILQPVVQKIGHQCVLRPTGMSEVYALPAFARKYKIACTQCHVAWPALNDYGRQFMIDGFVREKGSTEGAIDVKTEPWPMYLEQVFPWAGIVRSRPLDVANSPTSRKSLTAFNELDLFMAGGNIAKDFSVWAEIDLPAGGANLTTPTGDMTLGYHPSHYINLLLVNNRSFWALDPYQTLERVGNLTAIDRAFYVQGSSSGISMQSPRQLVAAYGQFVKEGVGSLYYRLGVGADKDGQGTGPKSFMARIALDSMRGVMVGSFGEFGESGWLNDAIAANPNGLTAAQIASAQQGNESVARYRYIRAGMDALVELAGVNFKTALLTMYDRDNANDPVVGPIAFANYDPTQPRDQYNRATYFEAFYPVIKGDLPVFVPLLRYDWWETLNRTQTNSSITAQIGGYVRPNVKVFLEYGTVLNGTSSAIGAGAGAKDSRWLLQGEVGF